MKLRALRGPLIAASAALLFALVLFARGHPYDLDQLGLALPYAHVFRGALRAHRAPLWTHEIWCGYPLHAEGQGGFFAFPFRLAAALAPGDEVLGLEVETTLALVLAAFAGALAARLRGRSEAASVACGLGWALGGGLLSYQENPAVLEACWAMPLLVALGPVASRTSTLAGGALLGLMLLAGWPYAFALTVPLLFFTWRWKSLAAAVGIGLLLGAAQWVPTAELFFQSDRAAGLDAVDVVGPGAFAPSDLARIVSPLIPLEERVTEHSVVFIYLGLPAVLLVLLGAWRSVGEKKRLLPATLVLALAIALLPKIAPETAARLVAWPPLSFVRGPNKLLIVFGLAASLLIAEGVDALSKRAWLAVLLVGLDLFQFGQRKALIVERDLLRATPEVARAIPPGERVHVVAPWSIGWRRGLDARAWARDATVEPNANILWGIPIVSGYGPLPVERSKMLAVYPVLALWARAGAEILVTPRGANIPALSQVGTFSTTKLLQVPGAVPFARLASDAVVASSSEMARRLSAELPPTVAVLEAPLAQSITEGSARVLRQEDDAVEIAVSARGPALLVVACTFAPGWEASVFTASGAEKSAPVVRADYAFQGVPLPAGTERVLLRYAPASFKLGVALSALGALALFGASLLTRTPRSSSPDGPPRSPS